jgi:hypothetical protein
MHVLAFSLLLVAQVVTPKGVVEPTAADAAAANLDDSAPSAQQKEQGKLFSGTWRCDGKANTEIATDVPQKTTLAFKSDGRWINVKIDEQKSKQNPKARTSMEIWGYSGALGGWVRNGADNQGGFYAGTSAGWVGDRFWWVVDSASNGARGKFKDTITKVNDKEIAFERAVDAGGETFRVVYEGTCKR